MDSTLASYKLQPIIGQKLSPITTFESKECNQLSILSKIKKKFVSLDILKT